MRSLLSEVDALADHDEAPREAAVSALRRQVWLHAAQGELDEPQLSLVLRALEETCPHPRP